jgi:hypothetical protein
VIVTISREYGAAGLGVADGVGAALGYELVSDALPATVADELGASHDEVAARAGAERPLSERMLGSLEAGNPEAISTASPGPADPFDEDVRRGIERTLRERAKRGNVVILGRMANAVLAGMPDQVRVFLTSGRAWRIERLIETFGFSRQQAEAELERVDAWRRKFARERYNVAWGDPRNYDLILDTSRFGIEATTRLIVAAVHAAER